MWFQRVAPNLGTRDYAGACLRFTQSVFGAPVRHRSAWHAWLNAPRRHFNRNFPKNVAVILWFEHYGRYNDGLGQYGPNKSDPYWGNWGHVVTWVPGRGYLSSPARNPADGRKTRQWFSTVEAVERTFGATYVGWSEGINGLLVVERKPVIPKPVIPKISRGRIVRKHKLGVNIMPMFIYLKDGAGKGQPLYAVFVLGQKGTWWQFTGKASAKELESQHGKPMGVAKHVFEGHKTRHQ